MKISFSLWIIIFMSPTMFLKKLEDKGVVVVKQVIDCLYSTCMLKWVSWVEVIEFSLSRIRQVELSFEP